MTRTLACLKVISNTQSPIRNVVLSSSTCGRATSGLPTGKLYGEALSLALGIVLVKRIPLIGAVGREGCQLSPKQVSRVRGYIRANLARDIGLAELADQLSLSPHYFSMLFKHASATPPHHYVLRERVQEGQRLLAAGRMSISEVALSLGFSDQSHFSQSVPKDDGARRQAVSKHMLTLRLVS